MATKQDQSNQGAHNAPVFYVDPATKKPINTGLCEAARADLNSRLIVGKEKVNNGTRPPTRPL